MLEIRLLGQFDVRQDGKLLAISSTPADALSVHSRICGSRSRPSTWARASCGWSVFRACARYSASRYSATNCEVKALVDATPISGPACV